MQEPEYLEKSPPKTYELSLYQSLNEVYFFFDEQLLFRFKASLVIESREINKLLQSKAILNLLDIRETRQLGWTVVKIGSQTGAAREGYTLFTMAEDASDPEIEIPPVLNEIWKPGHTLVDHQASRIYISRFNRT